jgi:hypothetical protein
LAPVSCSCLTKSKPSKSPKVILPIIEEALSDGGKIYFLLTLYDSRTGFTSFMELVKPYLKYMTTVDFGQATYKS